MWAYLFSKPRTEGATDEVELKREDQEFSTPILEGTITWVLRAPLFVHLGKRRVWVLVKADLTDAQAETISNNDCLLAGTAKLIWWEPVMGEDFRRTLDRNEANADRVVAELEELATLLKGSHPVCKDGSNEDALAYLTEKIESLPDGFNKDRLRAILARGSKEAKPEPKPKEETQH